MSSAAIEAINLHKEFPQKRKDRGKGLFGSKRAEPFVAVGDVSFSAACGEIFGLLGPNGAGKTTTIRMLCSLLHPTSGKARINGFDTVIEASKVRQSLGTVLTGERSVYWKLTGRENLEYFAAMYGLSRRDARQSAERTLKRLGMAERADELVEKYSSGMRQRIALGKALLADQPILLLDEPTIGLDPATAHSLRALIRELRDEGRTILLTTHYMEEADQLCDRVGIIDHGEIIALDSPGRLKETTGQSKRVDLELGEWSDEVGRRLFSIVGVRGATASYNGDTRSWHASVLLENGSETLVGIISVFSSLNVRVLRVQVAEPTLEDVFLRLTGKGLRSGSDELA